MICPPVEAVPSIPAANNGGKPIFFINGMVTEPVVTTFPGRSQGKGATVTDFGEKLIALYRAASTQAADAVAEQVTEIEGVIDRAYDSARIKKRRDAADGDDA